MLNSIEQDRLYAHQTLIQLGGAERSPEELIEHILGNHHPTTIESIRRVCEFVETFFKRYNQCFDRSDTSLLRQLHVNLWNVGNRAFWLFIDSNNLQEALNNNHGEVDSFVQAHSVEMFRIKLLSKNIDLFVANILRKFPLPELPTKEMTETSVPGMEASEVQALGRKHCTPDKLDKTDGEILRRFFKYASTEQRRLFFYHFIEEFKKEYDRKHSSEEIYGLQDKLSAIISSLPKELEIFDLSSCCLYVLKEFFPQLCNHCPKLRILNLNHCEMDTHERKHSTHLLLPQWNHLEELNMVSCKIDQNELSREFLFERLGKNMPKLKKLDLRKMDLSPSTIEVIKSNKALQNVKFGF